MINSKDHLLDFFASSIWEDISAILADVKAEHEIILHDEEASKRLIRRAQTAIKVIDDVLNLKDYVEEHYEEIEREERMDEEDE